MKAKKGTIAYFKENRILPNLSLPVVIKCSYTKKECQGFCVKQEYIDNRKDTTGTYGGWVPGCGGDVWWVRHDDNTVGAYMFNEIYDKE